MGQFAHLYSNPLWRNVLRPAQLAKEPTCRICRSKGRTTAATVADHVIPHRGEWSLFADPDNLQSLCKPCHDSEKQADERRGYSLACGVDGWPLDRKHPIWQDDFLPHKRTEDGK